MKLTEKEKIKILRSNKLTDDQKIRLIKKNLRMKHKEDLRLKMNDQEHRLTPRNGFFRNLFEGWLAIEQRLRSK